MFIKTIFKVTRNIKRTVNFALKWNCEFKGCQLFEMQSPLKECEQTFRDLLPYENMGQVP